MSVWTHVAGFFRLDSLVQIKKETRYVQRKAGVILE